MTYRKKLIEVALPLPEINDASAYDKMPGIGPHPKGIHHWWARLPLPAARAVIFASVVDDPSAQPEKFSTEEAQQAERERLFGIIRRMMQKQLHKYEEVYAEASAEMLRYCDGQLPAVLDPFAGGGSIPLEAARLGLEAYAGDLNPIAVLLNKCNLEIVLRWTHRPPVNPEDRAKIGGIDGWCGAAGVAADVRHYGNIVLARARQKIGNLYPQVKVTKQMAECRRELEPFLGKELPVIAWIWARTVSSPNPALRGAHVPLMSTFWLSSKRESEAWLEPVIDQGSGTWRFAVRTGAPENRAAIKAGTKLGRGAKFRCLLSGQPIDDEHIKAEGKAGRMSVRLVAIVAEGTHGRVYLEATPDHEEISQQARPNWKPDQPLADDPRNIWCVGYGLEVFSQLFTPRQLTAMVTLSDLVKAVREDVRCDAATAGLSSVETEAYAATIVTFLALALDRCTCFNANLCRWGPSNEKVMSLFDRQAIPMLWDFGEANTLGQSVGAWHTCNAYVADCVEVIAAGQKRPGYARQIDAAGSWDGLKDVLVSTDPPYYDNIGYSGLSDFFYVWLRRTIGDFYPSLFQTILVPKEPELVAAPERFGGDKQKAKGHFESGFRKAFAALRERMNPLFPLTVYYAFKQNDEDSASVEEEYRANAASIDSTTGWETMLHALVSTGFQITATWPVRASQKWRIVSMGTNALASYIILACRPRPASASQADRRSFVAELKRELPAALRHLRQGNIAPVDFAQAAIGPGMAMYSRYSRILEASGKAMTVRAALALINQTLTEVLSEQEDEFDADTRWAIAWFDQYGFQEGDFGDAELLSKAKVTSVEGLNRAGIVRRGGGKVRLLRPDELRRDSSTAKDRQPTVWEMTHQLLRVYHYEKAGDVVTADLLRNLGPQADFVRDLAYRLFALSEKRHRSQEAQAYNALVLGWPEIIRLAREGGASVARQAGLFGDAEG